MQAHEKLLALHEAASPFYSCYHEDEECDCKGKAKTFFVDKALVDALPEIAALVEANQDLVTNLAEFLKDSKNLELAERLRYAAIFATTSQMGLDAVLGEPK